MKRLFYLLVTVIMMGQIMPVAAMQEQSAYPWYKSYKNPEMQQKLRAQVTRGVQKTREFIVAYKKELGAIAALIGVYMTRRAYNQIFDAYGRQGIFLTQIRQQNKKEYMELIKLGVMAYANRLRDYAVKAAFINNLPSSNTFIAEKYKPALQAALWTIMGKTLKKK